MNVYNYLYKTLSQLDSSFDQQIQDKEMIITAYLFSQKSGFINNLSILDLLFHEGPQSTDFLKG